MRWEGGGGGEPPSVGRVLLSCKISADDGCEENDTECFSYVVGCFCSSSSLLCLDAFKSSVVVITNVFPASRTVSVIYSIRLNCLKCMFTINTVYVLNNNTTHFTRIQCEDSNKSPCTTSCLEIIHTRHSRIDRNFHLAPPI